MNKEYAAHSTHYNHIQSIHQKLLDHQWSRQTTRYDATFIGWLDKELLKIANEAYSITQEEGVRLNGDRDSATDALDGMLLIDFLKENQNIILTSLTEERCLELLKPDDRQWWHVYNTKETLYSGPSLGKALKVLKK